MTTTSPNLPLNFLKLLAHDVRWQLIAALAESDRRVQELVDALQRPQNLVSYHLRLLRKARLLRNGAAAPMRGMSTTPSTWTICVPIIWTAALLSIRP
jgi:predicted transcriptional regulator